MSQCYFILLFLLFPPLLWAQTVGESPLVSETRTSTTPASEGVGPVAEDPFAWEDEGILGRFKLHLSGFSYHFERGDNNETNWGLGVEYHYWRSEAEGWLWRNWESFVEFDVYEDSFHDLAFAGGLGIEREVIPFIDFGFRLGILYEKELVEKTGLFVQPYLLPYLQTSFDWYLNARLTIVPPVSDTISGVLILQFIVDF